MTRGMNKLTLTGLAMMFLPIAMVKLMAISLGLSSPSGATASTHHGADGSPLPRRSVPADWPEEERQAEAYVHTLAERPFDHSPLLYDQHTAQTTPSIQSPGSNYELQMIMTTVAGNVALINNVPYRVGDRLAGSQWVVIAINGDSREVALRHQESGREFVLRVD